MKKVTAFKSVLWTILGLALAAGVTRMIFGLGAITNQSDTTPWGLWKGFNVIPGIALAAGGFVVTAIIYVMRKHEYYRYAKIAVLMAFLGYLSAATALVVELGLPWMVWHPVVYWQHHSALFEVAWCVMLYLVVLFLEFIPVPMEETSRFAGVRRFLHKYKLILVVLGIMISTLHQSSLGTLFLITPEKLHPLWYTNLLPVLFFVSAIAVGPLMVILGVLTISAVYEKPLEREKLGKLALFSVGVLAVYALIRFIGLVAEGKLATMFVSSWQTLFFWIETALFVIIPILFLSVKQLRLSKAGLWVATISAVIGIGFNRANIAGIMLVRTGEIYIPTIFEIFISLGIISAAVLVFLFCVERFKMWETKWTDPRDRETAPPEFDRSSEAWLGSPRISHRFTFSFILIISLAFGFALISNERIHSEGIKEVPVKAARGGDTLYVDGNHDTFGVYFAHEDHIQREGKKESCVICHHMNLPMDESSPCSACHGNMYTEFDAFRHDWHSSPAGGNVGCMECHPEDQPRLAETAQSCEHCHKDLIPAGAEIEVDDYMAPSYTDAMHGVCVPCHETRAKQKEELKDLALCTSCHGFDHPEYLNKEIEMAFRDTSFNHVVLPFVGDLDKNREDIDD